MKAKILLWIFCLIALTGQVNAQQPKIKMKQEHKSGKMKMQEIKMSDNSFAQKAEDISPLLSGEKIPIVPLLDRTGKSVDLNKMIEAKPTILVFYRGGWCPYCSKQLAGLQTISNDLQALGYQLIAVSTDKPKGLNESVAEGNLDYTLLSDADLTVSKKFGIAFKAPKGYRELLPKSTGGKDIELLLPVPSIFI